VRILVLFLLQWICAAAAVANDSLDISQVLHRIRTLQVKENGDFARGMFASYREYDRHKDVFKADDNVFFTGLVIFTLRQLRPQLSVADQAVVDTICAEAAPVYTLFKNRKGRPTYNFWRTNPPVVFPNGGWLNLMNKSHALPDDMDDTAIVLMAMEAADSTVQQVHRLMQLHVNNGKKRKIHVRKDYKGIPAYSTWFGVHMPVDLDLCVLSNILHLVQTHGLAFSKADSASVQLICAAIDNGDYRIRPSYISPHYARTPIILYHLARLMEPGKIMALEQRKPLLVAEAKRQLGLVSNPVDKLILSIALLKWGQEAPVVQMAATADVFTEFEQNDFAFFIANMTSILPDTFRQSVGESGIGRFYYYSPAYNETLLLEYLLGIQQRKQLHN
jgi:hypothetical protein